MASSTYCRPYVVYTLLFIIMPILQLMVWCVEVKEKEEAVKSIRLKADDDDIGSPAGSAGLRLRNMVRSSEKY